MEILKSTSVLGFSSLYSPQAQEIEPEQVKHEYKIKRMANGHQVSKFYMRFIMLQKTYCILLIIQIFTSFLYYEIEYENYSQESTIILDALLLNGILSILLSSLALFSFNDWKNSEIKEYETLDSGYLIFKWLIILTQPYRWFQGMQIGNWNYKTKTYIPFKVNFLLVILSLLKMYLIIPCIMNFLKFKNPRSSRVCKIYGCSNSNLFQIKCYFKEAPITMVSCLFIISILLFSFAYRVSERNQQTVPNIFQYYQNCIWLVVITMTSVGFGDFAPITVLGRSVGFICTFCGVMTVSIMVLVVINIFQLDYAEDRSLKLLKKLDQKKETKKVAAQYIRLSLWRLWKNKQNRKQGLDYIQLQQSRDEKIKKNTLRQLSRLAKYHQFSEKDMGVEMNRHFQRISFNLQNLNSNCDSLINYLSNQYFININEIKQDKKFNFFFLK